MDVFQSGPHSEVQISWRPGGNSRFYWRDREHRDEVRGNAFADSSPFAIRAIARIRQHQQQRPCRKPVAWSAAHEELDHHTVQLGGPLKRTKRSSRASSELDEPDPTGPVANSTEISSRFNVKLTFQPTTRTRSSLAQHDSTDGRVGNWPAAQATDRQTVQETHSAGVELPGGRSGERLPEAKFTGYNGYYNSIQSTRHLTRSTV